MNANVVVAGQPEDAIGVIVSYLEQIPKTFDGVWAAVNEIPEENNPEPRASLPDMRHKRVKGIEVSMDISDNEPFVCRLERVGRKLAEPVAPVKKKFRQGVTVEGSPRLMRVGSSGVTDRVDRCSRQTLRAQRFRKGGLRLVRRSRRLRLGIDNRRACRLLGLRG